MKKAKLKYQDELQAEIRSNKSRVTKNAMELMKGCIDGGRKRP